MITTRSYYYLHEIACSMYKEQVKTVKFGQKEGLGNMFSSFYDCTV